jgi:hypothetical protein
MNKYYKLLKYWWWYNFIVHKDGKHKLLDYKTYYYSGSHWLIDSKYLANKMKYKFRLCEGLFKRK